MSAGKDDVIDIKLGLDIRDALRDAAVVNKELIDAIRGISKENKASSSVADKAAKNTKKGQKEAAKSYVETSAKVRGLTATIAALAEEASSASDEEKAAIEQRIHGLKQELVVRQKQEALAAKSHLNLAKRAKASARFAKEEIKRLKKAGSFADYAKDAGSRAGRNTAAGFIKKGRALSRSGGGGASKAGGAALMGIGKALSGVMKMMNLVGGGFLGLAKMFLDADAMVKEFNKDILDSASTTGFLEKGAVGIQSALDGVREAAMDAKFNLDWGITKATHVAIMNTLTQEGVSLDKLHDKAGNTREGMRDLSQQLVATSVAYSSNFGVATTEVAQMQAEMMADMGTTAEGTSEAFSLIATSAKDSNIAGNRFFSMIKSMSQDLSTWNMRLEDSVSMLGKLSKVMSPKDAEKFLQTLNTTYKQMGSHDKLKASLFIGAKKTEALVTRDQDRQAKAMSEKLAKASGGNAADILARFLAKGVKGVQSDIDKVSNEADKGAIFGEIADLDIARTQAKKGNYGVAQAMGGFSSGAAFEALILQLSAMGGSRDILSSQGAVLSHTNAEAQGITQEVVNQAIKTQMMMEMQRTSLLGNAKTDEEKSKINAMAYDEIAATMTEEMKEAAGLGTKDTADEKIRKLAKAQGKMTQSIMGSVEVIQDWLLSTFYNIMMSIWKFIKKIANIGGDDHGLAEMALTSKDANVKKAWAASGQDQWKFRGEMLNGGFGEELRAALRGPKAAEAGKAVLDGFSDDELLKALPDAFKSLGMEGKSPTIMRGAVGGKGAGTVQEQVQASLGKLDPEVKANLLGKLTNWMDPSKMPELSGKIKSEEAKKEEKEEEAEKEKEERERKAEKKAEREAAAGGNPGKLPPAVKKPLEVQKKTLEENKAQTEAVASVQTTAETTTKAVKDLPKEVGGEMLEAIRTALYEYYLYKDADASVVSKAFGSGGPNSGAMSAIKSAAAANGKGGVAKTLADMTTQVQPHATGGVVTGIANGMAIVAAQGEGLASIGKGERIVPAGGGGGGSPIQVNVNGIGGKDLARLIEGKVIEGVREFKSRERLQ